MKLKLALAGTVAVAASLLALPAVASAEAPAGPPPPVRINLHQAYGQALPDVRIGNIAGIVPTLRKRVTVRAARAATCAEPNCPLPYNGGPVQHSPHVYLLLWGPNWTTSDPAYAVMVHFYEGLGVTSHDTWSTITGQYGDSTGHPGFGASVFKGVFQDKNSPPANVSPTDLAAEADAFATEHKITDLADAQIVVASQSGTCFSDGFAGNCGVPQSGSSDYCAWHSYSNEPFTNLPYQLDAGTGCGENFINAGSAGTYDGTSIVGGHEYAESITDPDAADGWVDPADNVSGGEIGDKCAWGGQIWGSNDPAGDVTLSTGKFAMQSLWSNAAGGCVMFTDRVTVTSPGAQASTLGTKVSLQVHASSAAGLALSYRASALPSGLSISSAGLISGTPSVTAGTYATKVTATDTAGTSGSVSFTWSVKSGTGPVKGYASKCVDDYHSSSANGNKIDLYICNGGNGQKITFLASGGLELLGKCLRDSAGKVVLYTCSGSTTNLWTRHSDGEYVIRYNGQCLTAPSATNGTQLTLATCTDSAHQQWSLP